MFTGSPFFRVYQDSKSVHSGASWVFLVPGVLLSLMAIAILIWPELLAYMVASVLLFAGISLTLWGWSMRQIGRQQTQRTVYYEML